MRNLFARITTVESAPPWGLGTVALTILVAFLAIVIGTLVAAAWLGDAITGYIPPFAQLVGWLIGALLTIVFVLQNRRSTADRAALKLESGRVPLPYVMFLALGAAIAVDLVSLLITNVSTPAPELAGFNVAGASAADWIVAFAMMVIAQPIADELVFRGIAFPALRVIAGGVGGWLASAILYAAFHYLAFTTALAPGGFAALWYGLIVPFVAGAIFGIVRAATGSTRAAIVAHVAFGLFAVLRLLV